MALCSQKTTAETPKGATNALPHQTPPSETTGVTVKWSEHVRLAIALNTYIRMTFTAPNTAVSRVSIVPGERPENTRARAGVVPQF